MEWWEDVLMDDVRSRIVCEECDPLCRAMLAITSRANYTRYGPGEGHTRSIVELCYRYDTTTVLARTAASALNLFAPGRDLSRLLCQAFLGANTQLLSPCDIQRCNLEMLAGAVAQSEGLRTVQWLERNSDIVHKETLKFTLNAISYGNILLLRYIMLKYTIQNHYPLALRAIRTGQYAMAEYVVHQCVAAGWFTTFARMLVDDAIDTGNVAMAQLVYHHCPYLHYSALTAAIFSHSRHGAVGMGQTARR